MEVPVYTLSCLVVEDINPPVHEMQVFWDQEIHVGGSILVKADFDADKDGVPFEDDLCPNTADNMTVDATGCDALPAQCPGDIGTYNVIKGTDASETIRGTSGPDLIYGYGGDDIIDGAGGDDCIVGGPGDDRLKGGTGNDVLLGGDDDDELEGGNGNDKLFGEGGNDILNGGINNDRLDGGAGIDRLNGSTGTDVCSANDPGGTRSSCEQLLPIG